MKKAFTMIELIFVIVILGILAAVAIPKLMATRTDAKISKTASNIQTAKNEIAAYVTATGKFENNGSKMSNVIKEMETAGLAVNDTTNDTTTFYTETNDGGKEACIKFDWHNGHDLNISHLSATGDVCKGVQSIVKATLIQIKGQGVKY
jgi:general secretion pathway protein G